MWRKNTGAKPSSQASKTQEPAQTPAPSEANESVLAAAAVALEGKIALANEQSRDTEPVAEPAAASPVAEPAPASSTAAPYRAPAMTTPSLGPSRVNSGLKIRGEISGNTDLYIDGEVQGKLRFGHASVTVGPSGRVQADIEARDIVVEGSVQGTLRADESVRLGAQSHVKGNLLAPRIAIDDGARLSGKVDMTRHNGASPVTGAGTSDSPSTETSKPTKASALGAAV